MTAKLFAPALWVAAAMLMGAIVGSPPQAAGTDPEPGPAGLLRADVVVTDAGGQPVKGLSAADFEIVVDGESRPILSFSAGPSLLTVVILIDVTASLHLCPAGVAGIPSTAGTRSMTSLRGMRTPGKIPPAVDQFRLEGIETGDRVRIGAIGRRLVLSRRFTADTREIARDWGAAFGLPPIDWLGPSPIHDAVLEAVTLAAPEPGRRAVIVVTDGLATGNRHGHREVAALAARAGVSVSVVAEGIMMPTFPMKPLSAFGVDPTRDLQHLADVTGGILANDDGVWGGDGPCFQRFPSRHLTQIIRTLRGGYVLAFAAPTPEGGTRTLDVRAKVQGGVAHARRMW